MPKKTRTYAEAVFRFEHKQNRKSQKRTEKAQAHGAEMRARKRERQDAARLVKITHLRRELQRAARYPSLMTAKQLGDIARNPALPAEARVEAARLLQQWLFAEPEELTPTPKPIPKVPNGRKRRSPG